jgi:hypothetical protein
MLDSITICDIVVLNLDESCYYLEMIVSDSIWKGNTE